MQKHIEEYLNAHRAAWSQSTLKSEKYRLQSVVKFLDSRPETLWTELEKRSMKPYAKMTMWVRVSHFYDWLIKKGYQSGQNQYRDTDFREMHARSFKNFYTRKTVSLTLEEVASRLETLKDPAIKRKALELLDGGMRYQESFTFAEGRVVGKGGREREVFLSKIEGPEYKGSYDTFRVKLREVGLKPHDLRKVFLTSLVESGANIFQLKEIAGWQSITTATSYINVNKRALKELVAKSKGMKHVISRASKV